MRWRLIGAAAALALLVGCGPQDPPTTGRPTPNPAALNDGNGSAVPKLDLSRFPMASIAPGGRATGRLVGADVSWPQCPKGMGLAHKRSEGLPMPPPQARFVVIGLTNGPSFVPNPCVAAQAAWVKQRHLLAAAYSVVSYPDARTLRVLGSKGPYDAGTRLGRLSNVGYQAALFNVSTMRRVGLQTPVVWLDIESVDHFPWSRDLRANAAVVTGATRGYRTAGYNVGIYSIPALWHGIVGSYLPRLPEWRPAGTPDPADAIGRCAPGWSFGGGRAVLGQWLVGPQDLDLSCGTGMDTGAWFHKY